MRGSKRSVIRKSRSLSQWHALYNPLTYKREVGCHIPYMPIMRFCLVFSETITHRKPDVFISSTFISRAHFETRLMKLATFYSSPFHSLIFYGPPLPRPGRVPLQVCDKRIFRCDFDWQSNEHVTRKNWTHAFWVNGWVNISVFYRVDLVFTFNSRLLDMWTTEPGHFV